MAKYSFEPLYLVQEISYVSYGELYSNLYSMQIKSLFLTGSGSSSHTSKHVGSITSSRCIRAKNRKRKIQQKARRKESKTVGSIVLHLPNDPPLASGVPQITSRRQVHLTAPVNLIDPTLNGQFSYLALLYLV